MGAAASAANKETEETNGSAPTQTNQPDESSVNQTNQSGGSSPNKTKQSGASSPNQTPQPGASSPNKTKQSGASSPNQTPQPGASSPNKTKQSGASSPNQTPQPGASSPNKTNKADGTSSNQTNKPGGTSPNQTNKPDGGSVNQTKTGESLPNQTKTGGSSSNQKKGTSPNQTNQTKGTSLANKKVTVVFVLGGPGSGKGTQCANIVKNYGYTHLSAGDLLRAEMNSGSENGTMIQTMIKEGKIVPAEVTIKLLQKAMMDSSNDKFLIDGFPRNEENRSAFESVTGIEPSFILFFDCPEKEMEKRLLGRNQGREDDNIETIRKRFKVYLESSLPVIDYYTKKGKVRKIDAAKPADQVFTAVKAVFA